jgi:hypothetical protein
MTKIPAFILTEAEAKTVESVARRTAYKWPAVDPLDLTQELFLFAYSHAEQVKRFREREHGAGSFTLSLKRQAIRYCLKETGARQGQEVASDYNRNPLELESLETDLEAGD